jgi:hypothetical protein
MNGVYAIAGGCVHVKIGVSKRRHRRFGILYVNLSSFILSLVVKQYVKFSMSVVYRNAIQCFT